MKVKASTVKRRRNPVPQPPQKAPSSVDSQNFTITSRIKRPDVVSQYAGDRSSRPITKTMTKTRPNQSARSTGTKARQKAYVPGGRKSNATLYWALGGICAFSLILLVVIVIAGSSRPKPQRNVVTTPTTSTKRKAYKSNVKYGPGSWADDPDIRASIKGSALYKNRKDMKKNYKKDR